MIEKVGHVTTTKKVWANLERALKEGRERKKWRWSQAVESKKILTKGNVLLEKIRIDIFCYKFCEFLKFCLLKIIIFTQKQDKF